MAKEDRDWGYRRIQGAFANLGHVVGRSTIANIHKAHGLEPAPERNGKTTWKEILVRHWNVLEAADFFSIEIWTRKGLTLYIVLFLMDLSTRRVHIAGMARANGLWMAQVARNHTDDVDGFLRAKRYLILAFAAIPLFDRPLDRIRSSISSDLQVGLLFSDPTKRRGLPPSTCRAC
jgi:hypothetical protein